LITTTFPMRDVRTGVHLWLVPRITWPVSSRTFFDLNVPICISDTWYHQQRFLAAGPRNRLNEMGFDMFPGIHSIRAGIGVKL
jgi:hypothetical protein